MAGNISDYLEAKLLDHSLGRAAYTMPTTVKLALFKASPTDTGDLTNEVSGGAYARQTITFNVPSGGSTVNAADVTFPQATADWGTVTHIGVLDATTAGNMLWWGTLTAPKTVNSGDTFKVASGDLSVALD